MDVKKTVTKRLAIFVDIHTRRKGYFFYFCPFHACFQKPPTLLFLNVIIEDFIAYYFDREEGSNSNNNKSSELQFEELNLLSITE